MDQEDPMRMLMAMMGKGGGKGGKGGVSSDMLLAYFRGEGKDTEGRALAETRTWDFDRMEMVHNYVQWWFPTNEQSMFNMDAPFFSPELQKEFREDLRLQQELRENLKRFCSFLGFECACDETGCVNKIAVGAHFQERVPDCWSSMMGGNHNWLRISRVLLCLGLANMPTERDALMECLESIHTGRLANVQSSLPHWRKYSKTEPDPVT
mmetsp:Transcript_52736/g.83707  ORF Transcript_52736/g.83707 Transcript_52736/m.83707 type:complete len:209 (-) Transcript_52736:55-681(-)